MASAFPVVFVLFVVAGFMAVSWFSVRKGPQQTCVHTYSMSTAQPLADRQLTSPTRRLIRTGLMLTCACLYLMWAIAYLAQLHPLESKRILFSPSERTVLI